METYDLKSGALSNRSQKGTSPEKKDNWRKRNTPLTSSVWFTTTKDKKVPTNKVEPATISENQRGEKQLPPLQETEPKDSPDLQTEKQNSHIPTPNTSTEVFSRVFKPRQ